MRRLVDIGCNLLDLQFQGIYNGNAKHVADISQVLARSSEYCVERIIVTAGSVQESKDALQLALTSPALYSTVGVHPTRCNEFSADTQTHISQLKEIIDEGIRCSKVVAIGEFGLDWDRLNFCSTENQMAGFIAQFELCEYSGLPAFLHCRACGPDLIKVINEKRDMLKGGGVVHSFDGSMVEAQAIIDAGLYIGLNGCSLKTIENLEVVRSIPIEKILLETDAPWCEIRPSHAGYEHVKTHFTCKKREKFVSGLTVKGRQEPCHLQQVLEVVSAVKGVNIDYLASVVYANTMALFFPNDHSDSV